MALWDRQEGEPEDAHAQFQEYLAQRRPRRPLPGRGSPWTRHQLEAVAREWLWRERASLWDRHLDAVRQEAVERAVREDAEAVGVRQAELGRRLQDLGRAELDLLLEAVAAQSAPGLLTPRDVVRLAVLGARLERDAMGLLPERPASGPDLSGLSSADLAELRRIQGLVG